MAAASESIGPGDHGRRCDGARAAEPRGRVRLCSPSMNPHSTMPKWPAWLMAAFCAACTYPAITTLPPAAGPYRALGTEPFWSVTIADGRMTYDSPEGGFSVDAPAARATAGGRRFE